MAKSSIFHRIYDQDNRGVINLVVTEGDNLLDPYSDIDGTDIDSQVADYIVSHSNVYRVGDDIRLNIVSSHLDCSLGDTYKGAINRYFARLGYTVRQHIATHMAIALLLFILGVLSFGLLAIAKGHNFNDMTIMFIEICVWVFFWESVNVMFITSATEYRMAIRYSRLSRLVVTMISQKNIDNPL